MSRSSAPLVAAVLIPARDEAASIEACLDHVLGQDLPLDQLEVIVVDGGSADDTGERARALLGDSPVGRWEVVRTDGGPTPATLNTGLGEVKAPTVCRVDARSLVPPHYVRTCVEVLGSRHDVRVVGGSQVSVPRSTSARDLGIARALNNRFGMGLSRYRRGASSGPAETVYLGAFRTDELRAVGGWDERFATNQDFELNRRMGRDGLVWFESTLEVGYLPRRSLGELFEQYRRFGEWKVRYWTDTGDRPRARQLVMIVGPPVLAALVLLAVATGGLRRRAATVGAVVGAAAAVELVGSVAPSGPPLAHAYSAVASAAVSAGWLAGVWGALASARRRGRRSGG